MPISILPPEPTIPSAPEHGLVVKAPTKLGAAFEVVIPALSTELAFQIRRWDARGLTLPALGDEVLVLRDDLGEPWVAAWWPAKGDVALARDYGIVEALPAGTIAKGSLCVYKAAAGVYWRLAYTEEAEYPWAVIGGSPLSAASKSERELTNQITYASLPTDPLKITVPLKGDYDVGIEARLRAQASSRIGFLSYAVGATAASDDWCVQLYVGTSDASADYSKTTRQTALAASAEVIEKAKTGGNYLFQWLNRRLRAMPVRVG